jgi:pimeloyl-ACP methyl ester carboxylesterase
MSHAETSATVTTVRSHDGTALAVHTMGSGPGAVIVGGAFRSATDYLPLARALSRSATVHLLDRRGRGGSGPQGASYGLDVECADLEAVLEATGSRSAFGHSFGGLVVLETAARTSALDRVAVYDPAVSVAGSIPVDWLPGYRRLLDRGHGHAAFAHFVQGSGGAPAYVSRLPRWYLTAVLTVVMRQDWPAYEPLLDAAYHEHLEVGRADAGSLERFRSVTAGALLLGGSRSPAHLARQLLPALGAVIESSEVDVMDGLDHFAPDEKAPTTVAAALAAFWARS